MVAVAGLRRSRTDKLKYKHLLETQDIIPLFLASPDKMVWINGISQNNIGKNSAVHPLSLIVIGNGMADFFKDINKRNVSGYGKNGKSCWLAYEVCCRVWLIYNVPLLKEAYLTYAVRLLFPIAGTD